MSTPVEGVNVSPSAPPSDDFGIEGSTAPGDSCALDGLDLPDEDPTPCGHYRNVGKSGRSMVCIRGRHADHPDAHVCVAANGSHVPDRHGGTS